MAQTSSNNGNSELYFGGTPPVGTDYEDNASFFVTDTGTSTGNILEFWKFDAETSLWYMVPTGGTVCPAPMTRAALRALRTSGGLNVNCHYVITNPNAQGNLTAQKILLHAVDNSTLSMNVSILTSHDTLAWSGVYDIDTDDVLEVTDNLENKVISNASILNFPFGVSIVNGNTVMNRANLIHTSGNFINNVIETDATVIVVAGNVNRNTFGEQSNTTINSGDFLENKVENDATVISSTTGDVDNNTFKANSNTTINAGNFDNNEIHTDATVTSSGTSVDRNNFYSASNTTINSGDFRDNHIFSNANVVSSTSGDVDTNHFGQNSNSVISGAANVDNSTVGNDGNLTATGGTVNTVIIEQAGDLTISGGVLAATTISEDAQVTIISGSNYENRFGVSTIYNQVGTGYIRYSTIEGTTTWTNGNTNVSNVSSYVSTVNTTGSNGTIFNSLLNRAYLVSCQNIPSFTITDSTISNYGTVQTNGATRIYIYRSTITDSSRVLCSANSRIDMSYTNLDSYSYIQSTGNGGVTTANYCKASSLGYMRNLTTNNNRFDRVTVMSGGTARFDGNASGGRIYYSTSTSSGSIYQTTGSVNCYIYYCNAASFGQIYTQNSTNAILYYNDADSYSYIRSLNNAATHYIYYCKATSLGYVQMNNSGGRIYACQATSQSILEKRGAAGNIYYSMFSAYFHGYITRTGGTSSGLFGTGRRTQTVTNPTTIAPFAVGSAWLNFA